MGWQRRRQKQLISQSTSKRARGYGADKEQRISARERIKQGRDCSTVDNPCIKIQDQECSEPKAAFQRCRDEAGKDKSERGQRSQ